MRSLRYWHLFSGRTWGAARLGKQLDVDVFLRQERRCLTRPTLSFAIEIPDRLLARLLHIPRAHWCLGGMGYVVPEEKVSLPFFGPPPKPPSRVAGSGPRNVYTKCDFGLWGMSLAELLPAYASPHFDASITRLARAIFALQFLIPVSTSITATIRDSGVSDSAAALSFPNSPCFTWPRHSVASSISTQKGYALRGGRRPVYGGPNFTASRDSASQRAAGFGWRAGRGSQPLGCATTRLMTQLLGREEELASSKSRGG